MVLVLGTALFLNWYFGSGVSLSTAKKTTVENLGQAQYVNATTAENNYFKETRLKREKTFSSALLDANAGVNRTRFSVFGLNFLVPIVIFSILSIPKVR